MIKIENNTVSLPGILILFSISIIVSNCSAYQEGIVSKKNEQKIRQEIVEKARKYQGTKYRRAGKSPRGFDCSGYTRYVFKKNGIDLAASSKMQSKQGKYKDVKRAEPGDLVFFGPPLRIDHVGIVTQNNNGKLFVIHSTNSQGVVEHDVFQILYWKKRLKFARDVIYP